MMAIILRTNVNDDVAAHADRPQNRNHSVMSDIALFDDTGVPPAGWWEALWPDPARVVASIGVQAGMSVVDLCCGEGWLTLALARLAQRVVAIDADKERLATARHRLNEAGLKNCSFLEGDAYEVPDLLEDPVDFVVLANVFHGVPDRPRLVRAVASALRPAGLLAIVNWHSRPREKTRVLGEPRGPATALRMSPPQTIETVEPGGFNLANFVDVSPHHYAAVFTKAQADRGLVPGERSGPGSPA
jgi:2-polyprenyl-3-methyl-5-hydroxy-6-metoxy-1,4-benzoquinol methylase